MRTSWLAVLALFASSAWAGRLPSNLSQNDVGAVVQRLGLPLTMRFLRSAEALPAWPGIKIGLESAAAFPGGVAKLGDQTGVPEESTFLPRFSVAKGLAAGLEIAASFAPQESPTGNGSTGFGVKLTVVDERDHSWSGAVYATYTYIDLFRGDYFGHNGEVGFLWSKDYVRLRPFAGAGVVVARGTVRAMKVMSGHENTRSMAALHGFVGAELEYPANFTAQFDMYNEFPGASVFVGAKF